MIVQGLKSSDSEFDSVNYVTDQTGFFQFRIWMQHPDEAARFPPTSFPPPARFPPTATTHKKTECTLAVMHPACSLAVSCLRARSQLHVCMLVLTARPEMRVFCELLRACSLARDCERACRMHCWERAAGKRLRACGHANV